VHNIVSIEFTDIHGDKEVLFVCWKCRQTLRCY